MRITRARQLKGTVRLPGDKSISHRAAMIGAIADGLTRISNFASSADCASTLSCVEALGAPIERSGAEVRIRGNGKQGLAAPADALDCGNSGTTARLLSGILAGQPFEAELDGDASLRSRPMNRIITPLGLMGAGIRSDEGRLPLTIRGRRRLSAISYDLPIASAQIKSCVLLAGLNAEGETTVSEPASSSKGPVSRDHTEIMLRQFGAEIRTSDARSGDGFVHSVTVSGDSRLEAVPVVVPADVSSAAFFLVAGACIEGSEITMPRVGMNPTRSAVISALREMGAGIAIDDDPDSDGERTATLVVKGGIEAPKDTVRIAGDMIAGLIDELPVLAVMGTQLPGGLQVRDAAELRVKESDRISTVVANLRKMGARVEEYDDGFSVERSSLKGAAVDSYGDHRIAMAFAVAGLLADGETTISGAECAAVSFPGFFETLSQIVG